MSVRTLPSLLSLPELLIARNAGTTVQGTGSEAEADRLLISSRYAEAADNYQKLPLDDINRREKLAYCLFCDGQSDFYTVLDAQVECASPWGLALHLWAFKSGRFTLNTATDEQSERLAKILQCALASDSWPKLREYLIAGCWYQSLQQRHDTQQARTLQSEAAAALRKMASKLQDSLELCTRIFNYYGDRSEPQVLALRDLIKDISANDTPVLSALFSAAMVVRDTEQAKLALSELCRRYSDHEFLEQTVSAVALENDCPAFLDWAVSVTKCNTRGKVLHDYSLHPLDHRRARNANDHAYARRLAASHRPSSWAPTQHAESRGAAPVAAWAL